MLRTILSTQARALPPANVLMARKARNNASCVTSSASVRLPVSQKWRQKL